MVGPISFCELLFDGALVAASIVIHLRPHARAARDLTFAAKSKESKQRKASLGRRRLRRFPALLGVFQGTNFNCSLKKQKQRRPLQRPRDVGAISAAHCASNFPSCSSNCDLL